MAAAVGTSTEPIASISNYKNIFHTSLNKARVKLYMCLTKYHAMKMYPLFN